MVAAETGAPAPGGREGPRPLRVLLPLAKVNQTLPRSGGERRVRPRAGGERPEVGSPGLGAPGWGRGPASADTSASGPSWGRCSEIPGQGEGDRGDGVEGASD